MDNEGLLAWAEYEVERALLVLELAKAHRSDLRDVVRMERDEAEQNAIVKMHLKKLGVPVIVYSMASSLEEMLNMVTDKKAFLRKCGVSEEEVKP